MDEPDNAGLDDKHIELKVRKHFDDGRRLDQYIVTRMPQLSRAEAQRLILAGSVSLNGGKAKASHRVRPGDIITFDLPDHLDDKPEPEDIPLEIVYEDEFMVILNKPPQLLVHPGRGKENHSGTLTNALQFHFDKLSTIGGATRPGIVHRLDRDTSGVLLVAKDDLAHRNLALQFERRHVHKEYLALCHGDIDRDSDFIDRPIGPHPTVREKMAIRADERISRPANTFYQVLERFDGYCYVRAEPRTGRTHQIRVHLLSIGAPVVADAAYSGRSELRISDLAGPCEGETADEVLISRQALHAHRIRFRHPRCHEEMDITVPPPADFVRALDEIRRLRPTKR